jgi:hypothetical protein
MNKLNRNLLLAVAALFLLSALTYRQSVARGERFQRGQLFLANLNPDDVATIAVSQGEATVTLRRQGERFLVGEKQDYPASNSSVNRLLRDLLDIGLEREIGRGAGLQEELEIEPAGSDTVEVVLGGTGNQEMVRLRVGKTFEDGPGNYVQRFDEEDPAIYLTSGGVQISSDAGSFLDKLVVDHGASEVERVSGADFLLERATDGGDLTLAELAARKTAKTSEIGRLESALTGLRYEDVFVADASEISGLEFDVMLNIDLADGSGYALSLAERDDKSYLKIRGSSDVQQVAITVDESEEELQEKAEMLTRADEIDEFNRFHGSWVYEISEFTANKLRLTRQDLIETEND